MDELQILEEAETRQETALQTFLASVGTVARTYWGKVVDLLDLARPSDTLTKKQAWRQNIQSITRYRIQLRYLLSASGYDSAVGDLMQEMQGITLQIESYYEPMGLTAQGGGLEAAARDAMARTRDYLMETVAEQAFINPTEEVLMQGIMHGSSEADLIKQLRLRLIENDLPTRYVAQQAHDALWVYHRNYSASVGKELGLVHFYYDGVQTMNSREFCVVRKGKAFTKAEVESWATLEWQGKAAGTTKESIFWLCGGYRCIDVLRPMTKKLYDRLKEKELNA